MNKCGKYIMKNRGIITRAVLQGENHPLSVFLSHTYSYEMGAFKFQTLIGFKVKLIDI
jgi:hypothetical protein